MVVMIGINLLELRTIKTGDFLPGIVLVVLFVLADPFLGSLYRLRPRWWSPPPAPGHEAALSRRVSHRQLFQRSRPGR